MDKTKKVIVVIDEVDQFSRYEKAFTCFIKAVLA